MNTGRTQHLAELIKAKLEVLRQLHSVAERQLQVIGEDELSTLLSVLSAKQRVLEVLRQLDTQLAPYRLDDPDLRPWKSTAEREACRLQSERCEAILRDVLVLEKQAEQAMLQRRSEVSSQLQQLETTAEAGRAYVQTQSAAASSFDLSSEG